MNKQLQEAGFQRRTYKETEDYKVYLEEIHGCVVVHVAIYKARPSVIREIKKQWFDVATKTYAAGYDKLYAYTKDRRIIDYIGNATLIDVSNGYEVWEWDLN